MLFALGRARAAAPAARLAWVTMDGAARPSYNFTAFRAGLRSLGWAEGSTLQLDPWFADGSMDRLRALIPTMIASKPDLVVAAGGGLVRPLIESRLTMPMLFVMSADVVEARFVESWSRPGVQRSGISLFSTELLPKRVEMLKMLLPRMKRLALLGATSHPGDNAERLAAGEAASRLGLASEYWGAANTAELDAALESVAAWRADAVLVFAGSVAATYADRMATFSLARRIPTASAWANFAEAGNLMSYGPLIADSYYRLAAMADRVLKGADVAGMPVERPARFELVFNLKTARAIGVEVPKALLLRADRVIN
ncbi:MAG: ABC transporter substrate-binding protein [Burkholderiaceae bacterium]|nr:ABC transporter substrate-binding protein [Burkholderiaceae bacterium]